MERVKDGPDQADITVSETMERVKDGPIGYSKLGSFELAEVLSRRLAVKLIHRDVTSVMTDM